MEQYSGSAVADITEQIEDHDYSCCACKSGFNIGSGVRIDEDKFCHSCINQNNHYTFYADAGATIKNIIDLTNRFVDL